MALTDYEDALKSFIHDDDKLVTYKFISKEFEIHVNVAKDILKQYWEKYRDEESITATFLLMGQLNDGSIRVEVVKEANLKVAREKFIKVDCEHMYSLQKSLQDIELLAFAGEGDLRFSAIKCNEKFVRNDEEIESLRYVGNVRKEEPKSAGVNKVSSKVPEKQESKSDSTATKERESKNVVTQAKEKTKSDTNKKKGVAEKEKSNEKEKSDEAKLQAKVSPTEKKVEKKVSPPSKSSGNAKSNGKTSKKPVQSKQSGFNNLFGKVQTKQQVSNKPKEDTNSNEKKPSLSDDKEKEETKSKENKKIEEKEKEESQEKENRNQQSKKENKTSPKTENKIDNKSKSKVDNKSKTKVDNKSKSKNSKEVRGQKRNRSQESNTSSKRKRIVIADSSDDESDKSNEEEEEPMEVMEEPPKVARKRSPSPPAEKRENGKRMVRKTIDKTFKDEDGFLVTKRVHVYEAVSDDEDTVEVKKEQPKKAKPAETKVEAKKKQTSLMSFFKKS